MSESSNDPFAFVRDRGPEPIRRPPVQSRGIFNLVRILPFLAVTGGAAALALNYEGVIHIPFLEAWTWERLHPKRVADVPAPPIPVAPPLIRPSVAPPLPPRSFPQPVALEKPPKKVAPAEPSRKAVALALLESRDVVRADGGFVLRSEQVVKSRLADLDRSAETFNRDFDYLAEIRVSLARRDEIDQRISEIDAHVANLTFAMDQLPYSWRHGARFHGMNGLDNDNWEDMNRTRDHAKRERDANLRPQRDALTRNRPGQALPAAEAALKSSRETALAALNAMRAAVLATDRGYQEAARDAEIIRALATLGNLKLAPSPMYSAAVQKLGVYETSIGEKPTLSNEPTRPRRPTRR